MFSSILGKVSSAVGKAASYVGSKVANAFGNSIGSVSKQPASVSNALQAYAPYGFKPTSQQQANLAAEAIVNSGPRAYSPTSIQGVRNLIGSQSLSFSPISRFGADAPVGSQLPQPISSGPRTISKGSENLSTSSLLASADFAPMRAITTSSFGGDSASLTAPSASISPVVVPNAPASINPKVDNTALASPLAGYYNVKADGKLEEVKNEQEQQSTNDKIKERADLYEKYLGIKPGVYEDPEVQQARAERQQIREALLAPTSELNAIIAKQNQDLLSLRKTGAQEGVTEAVYSQQESAVNYNAAIRALPLKASIASLQGSLELAQDYLTELTQIKSDQINRQYEYNKALFSSITGVLDKEDERAYEQLVRANDRQFQRERDLIGLKEKVSMELLKKGVSSTVLGRVNNASTSDGVFAAAGNYLSEVSGSSNVNDNLSAYAAQYADTGKLPSPSELKLAGLSVGQVTSMAKQMPKPIGALVSNKTGTKSAALSPAQEDGVLALYDIVRKTSELKELEDKRVKGLTSATLGKVFGSRDQENYLNLRTEIIDLLARARTGAALTTQEEKFYKDQLPGRIGQVGFGILGANTQNKINNFEKKINGTLQTKLNGYDSSIYGYSKVKVGGQERTVGEILDIGGQKYRVLPDGTLTDII